MNVTAIFEKMLALLLLLAAGYICNRIGLLDAPFCTRLSRFVANVAMPAVVLSAAMGGGPAFSGADLLRLAAVALVLFGFLALAAWLVPRLWRPDPKELGTYRFMTLFPNSVFIGYPVVTALFGSQAVLYAAVLNLPHNFAVYSVGPLMLSGSGRRGPNWRLMLNPGLIATAGALFLMLTGLRLPGAIESAAEMLGGASTPLALIVIGSNLADMSPREVFGEPRMYLFSAFRLLILPLGLWLILRGFVSDPLVLGTAVVLAGMPAATNVVVLSAQYGGNERLGSQGVLLTTILSAITIPLIMYILFAA